MSDFGDNDAAADFFAREQQELGDLQDDLGYNVVPPADNGDFQDMLDEPQNGVGFGFQNGSPRGTPTLNEGLRSASPAMRSFSPAKPEPESLRLWRVEFEERLAKKDEIEANKKADMEKEARKEMDEWLKRIEEQREKRRQSNREHQQVYEKERDDTEAGGEWERVCRLCEFNPKSTSVKAVKDTTRMRGILLQLKTQPLVR